jgi:hypothetical protein
MDSVTIDVFVAWLRTSALSQTLQAHVYWLWPLCETLHFAGLAVLIGVAGMFDLRLLGFGRHVPITTVAELMPWARYGLAVNAATGAIFLLTAPQQYVRNFGWWMKAGFLGIAVLNAFVFEKRVRHRAAALLPGEPTPFLFKVVGAVSLISWFAVLYFGRMLPYIDADIGSGL